MNFKTHEGKGRFWLKKIALFVVLAPLFVVAFGYVVMALWNFTMPGIFGVSTITFWQAIALLLLSKILFSGFHGGKGYRHDHPRSTYWKQHWKSMTEEERAQYRERWRRWCDTRPSESAPPAKPEAAAEEHS